MRPLVYRRQLWVLVPLAVVLAAITLLQPWPGGWMCVVVFCLSFGLISARQRLSCTSEGVQVTVLRTRQVPWGEILGFEAGSTWRGGTRILTTSGVVWAPTPSSWWGGPALAHDLAALERARTTSRT